MSHFYSGKVKQAKLEEVLNLMASGFLRGGIGFLKNSAAGEMIKGSGSINREIRVGVTHVRACCICHLIALLSVNHRL